MSILFVLEIIYLAWNKTKMTKINEPKKKLNKIIHIRKRVWDQDNIR